MNNASYASYAEAGRLDFWQTIGGAIGTFILAHLAIDFRKQVRFGEPLRIETWVEKVGRTSITLRQEVFASNEVAAEVRSVLVTFDYEAGKAFEVPGAVRERLGEYASG